MVQFKLGDTVTICASVREFCGVNYQVYEIADINISLPPKCTIHTYPNSFTDCIAKQLNPSGVLLEFQWVSSSANTETHACADSVKLLILGNGFTDSSGKAAITYEIGQTDLDYFNANPKFELRVCIKNKLDTEVLTFGQVRSKFQAGDSISIVSDACYNVVCSKPICLDNKLYESKCDNNVGLCIADTTKLILDPCPTHHVDFDLSPLPQGFLDLVAENIIDIASILGPYLPGANVTYKTATYDSNTKKIRIYVDYTPTLSMLTYDEIYNHPEISSLVNIDIETWARVSVGIITFAIMARLIYRLGVWGIAGSLLLAVAAAVVVNYIIFDIMLDTSTPVTNPTVTPIKEIEIVENFVDTEGENAASDLYPTCDITPPTCDAETMRAYVGARGSIRYAQCMKLVSIKTDATDCVKIKDKITEIDQGLENGTLTPTQAKQMLEDEVVSPVKQAVTDTKPTITCSGGTWDIEKQECVYDVSNCWIKSPFSSKCILGASTGKKILILTGVGLVGYIIVKKSVKKVTS